MSQFAFLFFQVQFTKEGDTFQQSEVAALIGHITQTGDARPTDLLVMSHGWNNNTDEAKTLYSGLADKLAEQIRAMNALKTRRFSVCGALWPSKKFEDRDLIPGGAAALNEAVSEQHLRERIEDLKQLCNGDPNVDPRNAEAERALAEAQSLVDNLTEDPAAQKRAVQLIRGILSRDSADAEDASNRFFALREDELLGQLSRSLNPPPRVPERGGAAAIDPFSLEPVSGIGGAAGFRDVLGGIKSGFLHLLNFTTYYLMRDRAGKVGTKGVSPLIQVLRGTRPDLRVHLIGHSFGARVVTSAVNSLPGGNEFRANTMSLLQGAFSHNGFASQFDDTNDGAFREVVAQKKVRGPIVITHTRNDKAVGIAYPIASRLAGQVAAALGDENDLYGGLGSNGAQRTPERVVGALLDVGGDYPFKSGDISSRPYNLKADRFISGHSDIIKPQVAYAITVALASAGALAAGG